MVRVATAGKGNGKKKKKEKTKKGRVSWWGRRLSVIREGDMVGGTPEGQSSRAGGAACPREGGRKGRNLPTRYKGKSSTEEADKSRCEKKKKEITHQRAKTLHEPGQKNLGGTSLPS